MARAGEIYRNKSNQHNYKVYSTDGNNPPVPTHIKLVHLFLMGDRKVSILPWNRPQVYITIPIDHLDAHFTKVS